MTDVTDLLPTDASSALLLGRVEDPRVGPCLVLVDGHDCVDITDLGPTMSELLARTDLAQALAGVADGRPRWALADLVAATEAEDRTRARLLAPIDLQVIKAAGVTFARSMVERVIEERAKGDPQQASEIRTRLAGALGAQLAELRAGSAQAAEAKRVLVAEGLWSQYLEVGIGPDPEIFTKSAVLSAVGSHAAVGVLARSSWNNPEPEVVLVGNDRGQIVGATLGNDVNLRDFEGRSALLLTEAKDNNASCAIGPFVRVFDDGFTLDDVRALTVELTITGTDGFGLTASSSMAEISRDPEDLVRHAYGPHHRYPDGFVLFTGTMFAPTEDRDAPGEGFTHHLGDVVTIATPQLGTLTNRVRTAEDAPDWTVGIVALMRNLAGRGLLTD